MNSAFALKTLAVVAAVGSTYVGYTSSSESCPDRPASMAHDATKATPANGAEPVTDRLDWSELITFDGGRPALSPKAQRLEGHRVQMAGFMAKLELGPKGGFYMASSPVISDESGAGTADLPLESVLVLSHNVATEPVAWMSGPIEVSGRLELGPLEDSEGRANWIRLRLD